MLSEILRERQKGGYMKYLLELFKNINKKLYLFFLTIVILVNFGVWNALKLYREPLIQSGKLLIGSTWSFAFLIVLFICVISLLKKSDRESEKHIDEHLFRPSNFETDGDVVNVSYVKTYEEKRPNEIVGSIEVKINNISEDKIEILRGRVFFYKKRLELRNLILKL